MQLLATLLHNQNCVQNDRIIYRMTALDIIYWPFSRHFYGNKLCSSSRSNCSFTRKQQSRLHTGDFQEKWREASRVF